MALRLIARVSFAILLLAAVGVRAAETTPVVDLKTQSRVVLKNLPWEFYWQKLLTPSDFSDASLKPDLVLPATTIWNRLTISGRQLGSFGFATYRLRFTVSGHSERLGLRLPAPLSAFRLYINGEKLAEEGSLTTSPENFEARRRTSLHFFRLQDGNVEIVIQVANFLLYKGGLRSEIELGHAPAIQKYGMRYFAIDLFGMGLIFSIMLYHFLLYFLSRKDLAILIFAGLGLDYFILTTLFGEQTTSLFIPGLHMDIHTRLTSACTYLLPALVVEFTGTLYPGTVPATTKRVFWLLAGMFILLLVLPPRVFLFYNVLYYMIVGGAGGAVSMWAVFRAVRENRAGARLLAAGILVLMALTVYAVFLVASDSQAGSFLSLGFSIFALTQSGSLAHAHAALTRENSAMQLSLERSRQALDSQRKQIEANLHDSLGGNLTDIKLGLEAIEKDPRAARLKPEIRRLDQRVGGTIASLRTQLLFLEDMQMAVNDFVSGINLILLRRYQMARRPVEIRVSPESRAQSRNLIANRVISEENIPELCLIVQELCSNTLKYSAGTAEWEITATGTGLQIRVNTKSRRAPSGSGRGRHTLRARTEAIGAKFEEVFSGRNYQASVEMRSSS
ncbi:MAG TPA: 7TM diverse intracellular signaling domain-containing protein [Turneriella sp.]|nr:7TM diverse intracellular signaling domain-containing protein [Turneriella sp.]